MGLVELCGVEWRGVTIIKPSSTAPAMKLWQLCVVVGVVIAFLVWLVIVVAVV